MNVGVPSLIALWAIIVSGCAGNEISPAVSAATAPGNGDPIAALYAAPADIAFITVSDISAAIVGPADVPPAAFLGYSYEPEMVAPFVELLDDDTLSPPILAGPETVTSPASDIGWDSLSPPPDAK